MSFLCYPVGIILIAGKIMPSLPTGNHDAIRPELDGLVPADFPEAYADASA